jgi:hypothetical protein
MAQVTGAVNHVVNNPRKVAQYRQMTGMADFWLDIDETSSSCFDKSPSVWLAPATEKVSSVK